VGVAAVIYEVSRAAVCRRYRELYTRQHDSVWNSVCLHTTCDMFALWKRERTV